MMGGHAPLDQLGSWNLSSLKTATEGIEETGSTSTPTGPHGWIVAIAMETAQTEEPGSGPETTSPIHAGDVDQ